MKFRICFMVILMTLFCSSLSARKQALLISPIVLDVRTDTIKTASMQIRYYRKYSRKTYLALGTTLPGKGGGLGFQLGFRFDVKRSDLKKWYYLPYIFVRARGSEDEGRSYMLGAGIEGGYSWIIERHFMIELGAGASTFYIFSDSDANNEIPINLNTYISLGYSW